MDPRIERRTVHYSGRVQGVGFRWQVNRIVQMTRVTGYVRNLEDGRVELVAEGTSGELTEILEGIRRAMGAHIRHEFSVTSLPSGEFKEFRVAR